MQMYSAWERQGTLYNYKLQGLEYKKWCMECVSALKTLLVDYATTVATARRFQISLLRKIMQILPTAGGVCFMQIQYLQSNKTVF